MRKKYYVKFATELKVLSLGSFLLYKNKGITLATKAFVFPMDYSSDMVKNTLVV